MMTASFKRKKASLLIALVQLRQLHTTLERVDTPQVDIDVASNLLNYIPTPQQLSVILVQIETVSTQEHLKKYYERELKDALISLLSKLYAIQTQNHLKGSLKSSIASTIKSLESTL